MTVASASSFRAPRWAIWAALSAVYIIWGSTYLAIRYAVETTPPFLMAATRFLVSGGLLYGLRRACGDPAPRPVEWRSAAIIGIFLLVGGNGGVVWAEQFVASGLVALLVATVPLWMVLIDAFRPGGRWPELRAVMGIVVGFGGVVLLITSAATNTGPMNVWGACAVGVASFSWALGSIYSRGAALPPSQLLGTAMEMLMGGVALTFVGSLAGEWRGLDVTSFSIRSTLALSYLIVFGSGGFAAYVWLLRVAPTPLVSTYAYVNPVVAIVLSHLLAEEALTVRTLLAAMLIVGSVALVSVPRRSKETLAQNSQGKEIESKG